MTSELPPSAGFQGLGLKPELLATLADLGYEEPTPIQRATLPLLLAGRDVLGQAATGTGKTAAFALPMLQRIELGACQAFQTSALVIVPTRELAMQVAEAIHSYGRRLGVTVLAVYGGQDIFQQLRHLKRGVDVVVATPGRAVDHLNRSSLKLDRVKLVVLDEADEMLDMGFAEELDAVLSKLPEERQTALFSATLPPRIAAIAERHLNNPARVRIAPEKVDAGTLPKIRQVAYVVPRPQKAIALGRLLDIEAPTSAIVFARTRVEVDELTEALAGHGYDAAALHGGMSQEQRDRVLKRFKSHQVKLLVATDVAARGLHVDKLSHVINYDVPTDPDAYVHRIGRTGRAGKEGVAITLLDSRELRLLKNIERVTRQPIALGRVPTVLDLRARRLALTRAMVEETLAANPDQSYRSTVEQLAAEHDLATVAAAALQRLHEALNPEREDEAAGDVPAFEERPRRAERPPRSGRAESSPPRQARGARGDRAHPLGDTTRLFIGLGRRVGLRPADLVGAIANEAGLSSQQIGAIQITDEHAFVEIPTEHADAVIRALRASTLRGHKPKVDRERARPPKK